MTISATPTPSPTPRTFVVPDLVGDCPFEHHVNEDIVKATYESKAWMFGGSNLSRNEKTVNALHGLKGAELTSACWAFVPYHRLKACSDFINWLFHLDNISDDMDDKSTNGVAKEVMTTLTDPDTYDPKTDVGKLTKCLWTRVKSEASPGTQKRFINTMDLFFKAVTVQAHHRAAGVIPNLEDYIAMRRDTSGCKPSWALVEYGYGLDLPDEVMDNSIVQSLGEAANDLVTWSNDIFSYNSEQSKGDTHNMIVVMMHHHGMSLQEAVDFVGDQCKKSIHRFIEDTHRLPSWGPELDEQVQAYVRGLADWIIGSLHWSYDTERYFGRRGPEIKKSRVVELLPVRISEAVVLENPAQKGSEVRVC